MLKRNINDTKRLLQKIPKSHRDWAERLFEEPKRVAKLVKLCDGLRAHAIRKGIKNKDYFLEELRFLGIGDKVIDAEDFIKDIYQLHINK